MALLKKEPAVIIGVLAACVLAVVQTLAGEGVIGADLSDTVTKALDPTTGWALPIILGIVTRFFVYSPAKADELLHTPPPTD